MIKNKDSRYTNHSLSIDIAKMNILLSNKGYETGDSSGKNTSIDLNQTVGICLVREGVDYAKREKEAKELQEAADNQGKDNLAGNVIAGAVAGGFIDALSGEDDSILDGALIGGLLGAAMTTNSKTQIIIDLVEQKNHFILLLFKNGDSLKIMANAEGLADLVQVVSKSVAKQAQTNDPFTEEQLNNHQLKAAAKFRRNTYFDKHRKYSPAYVLSLIALLVGSILYLILKVTSGEMFELIMFLPSSFIAVGGVFGLKYIIRWEENKLTKAFKTNVIHG